jgi:hypothetical protein
MNSDRSSVFLANANIPGFRPDLDQVLRLPR